MNIPRVPLQFTSSTCVSRRTDTCLERGVSLESGAVWHRGNDER